MDAAVCCCRSIRAKQRAQTTQRQIGVERRSGHARHVGPRAQRFEIRKHCCDHRAADHVGMAVQVFGGGMNHEVGPERHRPLQRRRHEGVVDDHLAAGRLGLSRDGAMSTMRISGLLGVSIRIIAGEAANARSSASPLLWSTNSHSHVAAVAPSRQQTIGAAIAVMRCDDQIAAAELSEHQIKRRHSGAVCRGRRLLRVGQFRPASPVSDSPFAYSHRRRCVRSRQRQRCSKISRRHDRAERRVGCDAVGGGDGLRRLGIGHEECLAGDGRRSKQNCECYAESVKCACKSPQRCSALRVFAAITADGIGDAVPML